MEKPELLALVTDLARKDLLNKEELVSAYDQGRAPVASAERTSETPMSIAALLAYLGALVVVVGIGVFIAQQWKDLGWTTRIVSTLGSSLAAYIVGFVLVQNSGLERLGDGFFLVAGAVMPVGLFVVLDSMNYQLSDLGTQSMVFGALALTHLVSHLVLKRNILLMFTVLFSTVLFYCLCEWLLKGSDFLSHVDRANYQSLTVGSTYLALGWAFSQDERAPLSGFLYFFGINLTLGSVLMLGGWRPQQRLAWEIIYPLLNLAALYLSVILKNRTLLTFGTIYLMAYLAKITIEYFRDSLGWSLSLVLIGFLFMAISYTSVQLNRRYIRAA